MPSAVSTCVSDRAVRPLNETMHNGKGESVDSFATSTSHLPETQIRTWARQAILGWFTGHDGGFDELAFQEYDVRVLRDGFFEFTHRETKVKQRFDIAVVVVSEIDE